MEGFERTATARVAADALACLLGCAACSASRACWAAGKAPRRRGEALAPSLTASVAAAGSANVRSARCRIWSGASCRRPHTSLQPFSAGSQASSSARGVGCGAQAQRTPADTAEGSSGRVQAEEAGGTRTAALALAFNNDQAVSRGCLQHGRAMVVGMVPCSEKGGRDSKCRSTERESCSAGRQAGGRSAAQPTASRQRTAHREPCAAWGAQPCCRQLKLPTPGPGSGASGTHSAGRACGQAGCWNSWPGGQARHRASACQAPKQRCCRTLWNHVLGGGRGRL